MDDIKPAPKPSQTNSNDETPVTTENAGAVADDTQQTSLSSAEPSEPTATSDLTAAPVVSSTDSEEPLDSSDTPVVSSNGSNTVVSAAPEHGHRKTLMIALVLVLLAILGAGAYFFLVKAKSTPTTTAATSTAVKKDIPNISFVTLNSGWDKFYPGIDVSSNYEEANREIFEGLVRYENRTKIVPLLATGWTNPDTSTWVFNLKHGVQFHTGREMTAQDVKLSFEAAKDSDIAQTFADTINTVTVTGPYQVTIKTTAPDATLLNKLANYYVYDTKSGKANDAINGTGAFTLKPGFAVKPDSLELVAFDKYHGGRPHVRSISFIGLADNDHGKAYETNKANVMALSTDTPSAVKTRKFNQIVPQPLSVQIMPLNTLKAGSPLKNLKVRQALKQALDQKAIAKARGISYEAATQLVPKAIPGFNSEIKAPTTNVAAAKQLLTDAGYPNGFTIKLSFYKTGPIVSEVAEITKEMAQIGVTITADPQTDPSVLGALAFSGKTDSFVLTMTSDLLDSSDVLLQYADSANYHNQTVLDLITKAQAANDPAKHISYLQQANKAMMDDASVLPLFTPVDDNSYIYDPSFVIQRDIENNDLGVYFWKVYAQ